MPELLQYNEAEWRITKKNNNDLELLSKSSKKTYAIPGKVRVLRQLESNSNVFLLIREFVRNSLYPNQFLRLRLTGNSMQIEFTHNSFTNWSFNGNGDLIIFDGKTYSISKNSFM